MATNVKIAKNMRTTCKTRPLQDAGLLGSSWASPWAGCPLIWANHHGKFTNKPNGQLKVGIFTLALLLQLSFHVKYFYIWGWHTTLESWWCVKLTSSAILAPSPDPQARLGVCRLYTREKKIMSVWKGYYLESKAYPTIQYCKSRITAKNGPFWKSCFK